MRLKAFSISIFLLAAFTLHAQDSSYFQRKKYRHLSDSNNTKLKEVLVQQKQSDFGFTRLRAVENLGIYEGKKTEVIIPDQLIANLSTNNARQIFSRVAGLNIWENDGAGLQLNIGGRGLDPNRSSNFNVRQNGYDISADALGYPESYYTPPMEAVGKIQIVRGAASLQYGTQFGGLINFMMKQPIKDKKIEVQLRQSIGSFGFYNSFTSLSGTIGKISYYTFFQYKQMQGWRENSELTSLNAYSHLQYQFNKKAKLGLEYTHMNYLAHQAGGLSDAMFANDPMQTNRERNWFDVNWNLFALHYDHKFNAGNEFNARLFGLDAHRYSVGFRPNRVATIDNNQERDLITGKFQNYGAEFRYLKRFFIHNKALVFLSGTRYYHGFNHSIQGMGSKSKTADFNFIDAQNAIANDYTFPNENVSVFAENIFYLNDHFSITPGIRMEYIHTRAKGYYNTVLYDLAGNIISSKQTTENRNNERKFIIAGLGISYKPGKHIECYGNGSQNYRSITFSDMRISNPSQVIDPDMSDERGYSFDLGIRSYETQLYTFDVSGFILNYNNRIGEIQFYDSYNRIMRMRTNIGQAMMMGIESYAEADILRLLYPKHETLTGVLFVNMAYIHSEYKSSKMPGVAGNSVEFVPDFNIKSGIRLGRKNLKATFQVSYLSDQYSDATNAIDGGVSAVVGLIPAYAVMDASVSYQWKKLKFEISSNNLGNNAYFTRRATGYPGPGILPSDGRSIFLTVSYKI